MLSWDDYNDENTQNIPQTSEKTVAAPVREAALEQLEKNETTSAAVPPSNTTAPETPAQASAEPLTESAAPGKTEQSTASTDEPAADSANEIARAKAAVEALDVAPGLEELDMGAARIEVDDKRMINCRADLNQLVPFKYEWAWQKYLDGCAINVIAKMQGIVS